MAVEKPNNPATAAAGYPRQYSGQWAHNSVAQRLQPVCFHRMPAKGQICAKPRGLTELLPDL